MKIRINGKTVKSENIHSIGKIQTTTIENKIIFYFDIGYNNKTWDWLYFYTPIYMGAIHTEVFYENGKSKSYWFKDLNFVKELKEYKEVYEIAVENRNELESLWDKNVGISPIPEFNTYKK